MTTAKKQNIMKNLFLFLGCCLFISLPSFGINPQYGQTKPKNKIQNSQQKNPKAQLKYIKVRAEVFHFISTSGNPNSYGYYKDTGRKEVISITFWPDGKVRLSNADIFSPGCVVRYSDKKGYEFEANINNTTWAFNYEDVVE